jgi:hypothetical protein
MRRAVCGACADRTVCAARTCPHLPSLRMCNARRPLRPRRLRRSRLGNCKKLQLARLSALSAGQDLCHSTIDYIVLDTIIVFGFVKIIYIVLDTIIVFGLFVQEVGPFDVGAACVAVAQCLGIG